LCYLDRLGLLSLRRLRLRLRRLSLLHLSQSGRLCSVHCSDPFIPIRTRSKRMCLCHEVLELRMRTTLPDSPKCGGDCASGGDGVHSGACRRSDDIGGCRVQDETQLAHDRVEEPAFALCTLTQRLEHSFGMVLVVENDEAEQLADGRAVPVHRQDPIVRPINC
jgi:hypothetical protein